jgi:hypothetical protein
MTTSPTRSPIRLTRRAVRGLGETIWWGRVLLAPLLVFSCDDRGDPDRGAPTSAFLPGATVARVDPATKANATQLTRPEVAVTYAPCAAGLDAAFELGVIESAVGHVTYAWLGADEAQTLAKQGLMLPTKTTQFEDRVRRWGTNKQALDIDALLQRTTGALSSWPRPWANRTSLADGYLLQVTLRVDALWLTDVDGEAVLIDGSGAVQTLGLDSAITSERVAGVFFSSHKSNDGECAAPFSTRELVITNAFAIESWALGTDPVVAALQSQTLELQGLLDHVRSCAYPLGITAWSQAVACANTAVPPLWFDYAGNLASVDGVYYPSARNLARLLDALAGDVWRWQTQPIVAQSHPSLLDAGSNTSEQYTSSDAHFCVGSQNGTSCSMATNVDAGSRAQSPTDATSNSALLDAALLDTAAHQDAASAEGTL